MAGALDQVEVAYGARQALGPFSLKLESGEIVALVGASGCGKSTALRLLAGLEQPTRGKVERLAGRGETSVVFQSPTLMPWATVSANVGLPLTLTGADPKAQHEEVSTQLERVGLAAHGKAKPAQLSGGMAMRVSLARALVTHPRLLLLDEPFAALDEITRRDLAADIHRLWAGERPTIVFVTHSVEEAVYMSSRVIVMTRGPGRLSSETRVEAPLPRPEGFRTTALYRGLVEEVSASLAKAMIA
ncbi:MAG TPA: ABC transporter ATP-binding protein [Caulobacteraceae bacterium]|jgi:NitT/TauT family transport system ATP-binding protein